MTEKLKKFEPKAFPKTLIKWREPVPVRIERLRRLRANEPPFIPYLWIGLSFLIAGGGLLYGFGMKHEAGAGGCAEDRGVILAVVGFFLLAARFFPVALARVPTCAALTEQAIGLYVTLPPKAIFYHWDVRFAFREIRIEARPYKIIDVFYARPDGKTGRCIVGVSKDRAIKDIGDLLIEKGCRLVDDIDKVIAEQSGERPAGPA